MKMFYGHLIAFGMMTGFCFVGLSVMMLFLPLFFAFVSWDLSPLAFGWSSTFMWMRFIFAASSIIGVWFACSEEGRSLAKDLANG